MEPSTQSQTLLERFLNQAEPPQWDVDPADDDDDDDDDVSGNATDDEEEMDDTTEEDDGSQSDGSNDLDWGE
ncbi:hypothetical protein GCM10020331_091660 [Ectobacillus funiculus]